MSLLMKDMLKAEDTSPALVLSKVEVLSDGNAPLRSLSVVEVSECPALRSDGVELTVSAAPINSNSLHQPPADYRSPTLATATINAQSLLDLQMIVTVVQLSPHVDSSTTDENNNDQ